MIQLFPGDKRYTVKNDWLDSSLGFSFGEYYDPNNLRFGPLRVFNDDTVQAGHGFGIHPHREAEIVSIILKGQLKHEDNLGNSGILGHGSIQRITAGTGVLHSEFNASNDEEVQFLQLWFSPNEKGLQPSYEDISYDISKLHNQLLPVISHTSSDQVARIHQDLTLYLSRLDGKKILSFEQESGRKIYVFNIEGEISINNDFILKSRDAARITDIHEITIQGNQDSFFLLIDLPGGDF
ncbi:pirin family protein [Neobacillus cucumis]|uniref:pirin family protein n=1 Tax=Neobacillus cucumis TaxID=1740721 RepID=UPI00203CF375|nr:pirin family protein [Neobacillus cucumis]MCM3728388.1 pirin family protein [Neobacillus cucumis]